MDHLFIIASDQEDLRNYLVREFAAEEAVQVVLDRRSGRERRSGRDRRAAPRAGANDRRRDHRRVRPSLDPQLRSLGYAMLRV
jgi:hypothetical protein